MMRSSETAVMTQTTSNQVKAAAPVRRHHHRHNVKSRYNFIKTLGKGTYGKVKLAQHKETNQLVAIKAIRKDRVKDSVDMRHIRREMEIMSSIQHPHIIQIYEVFENQDKIVIVMEYAAGGELYDHLSARKGVSNEEARRFFSQIVSAIQYCHRRGIVHRDLKLENILLDEERRIKIADFGLANYFRSDNLLSTFCGSPLYASPEIVCGVPYKGPEVDSWSLGVLLYALVYGTMPFDGRNFPILTKQITTGSFCKPAKLSDAHDLIHWMLTVDPRHRATIDDIAGHEWIVAGKTRKSYSEGRTPEATSFSEYLESSMEQCEGSDSDLNSTLKATDNDSMQPKSILKYKNGSGDESPPPMQEKQSENEKLDGQLAVVCGLHAKDSLKLKAKPHSASGKRRVLRSRRDRESGYYSSPERVNGTRDTSTSSDAAKLNNNVPQIKSTLVSGGRMAKLGVKPANALSKPSPVQTAPKECYLMPINPGPDERLPSLSSDDGYSVRSQSRPASTYSDSSILSSDSFDLCTFENAGPGRPDSNVPPSGVSNSNRPSSLPNETVSNFNNTSGSLTPKSEKLVRDLQRILGPSGRRGQNKVPERNPERRPRSLDESSHLSSMANQLNVELDMAYKKGVDICANLRSAEV